MAKSLLDVLRDVSLDPSEQAAFAADPPGYLAQYGYQDVQADDLAEAFSLVADTLPPDAAAAVPSSSVVPPAETAPPGVGDDLGASQAVTPPTGDELDAGYGADFGPDDDELDDASFGGGAAEAEIDSDTDTAADYAGQAGDTADVASADAMAFGEGSVDADLTEADLPDEAVGLAGWSDAPDGPVEAEAGFDQGALSDLGTDDLGADIESFGGEDDSFGDGGDDFGAGESFGGDDGLGGDDFDDIGSF